MFSELQIFIEKQILGGGLGFVPLIFLFIGGFLASLLPCVYPLYPITAGILSKRTADASQKKWSHPLVYYMGLSSTYFGFGLIAGFTGGAFNTFLRYPETNLFFSYLLFILALTSAELLIIPIFSGNQFSSSKSSYANSFFLGVGAGLLSSPCVGPVVVTVLVQLISNQNEGIQILSLLGTSIKMLFFGLGLGLPFLLIGVFGFALPKSGKWMKFIQSFLSLLILYFSYTYLEKATNIWGLESSAAILYFFLWCLVIYLFFLKTKTENYLHQRVKSALLNSTLFFLFALFLLHVNSENNRNFLKHLNFLPNTSNSDLNSESFDSSSFQKEIHGNLIWYRNEADVWRMSKQSGLPVFIDFYADWCTNCKEFQKLTLKDSQLNVSLKDKAILWKIYDTDPIFETFQENPKYIELKIGLPFFLVLGSDGHLIYKTNDYLDTKGMVNAIQRPK